MRTTVTIDDDLADHVRRLAAERGITFKDALNRSIRAGLAHQAAPRPFKTPARPMRVRRGVDVTKALRLAGELEDEEIARKHELGK
jgi:hypothetical protein